MKPQTTPATAVCVAIAIICVGAGSAAEWGGGVGALTILALFGTVIASAPSRTTYPGPGLLQPSPRPWYRFCCWVSLVPAQWSRRTCDIRCAGRGYSTHSTSHP